VAHGFFNDVGFERELVMTKRIVFGLVVATIVALPFTAEASGGFWTIYNPCPWLQPFQHCNVFGNCYCSFWP